MLMRAGRSPKKEKVNVMILCATNVSLLADSEFASYFALRLRKCCTQSFSQFKTTKNSQK